MNDFDRLTQISILWMHLDEASFLISTAREKELKKRNLSSVQMKVLLTLNYLGRALTIHELCRWIVRGHTSISLLTDKMVNKGLVKKYQDTDNKNQTRVVITKKGQATLHKLVSRKPIPEVLSVLSEGECNQLILSLEKIIHRAVDVVSPHYPPNLEELKKMITVGTK